MVKVSYAPGPGDRKSTGTLANILQIEGDESFAALTTTFSYHRFLFQNSRQDWSIVYPCVSLTEAELRPLGEEQTFVAGFIDKSIENRNEIFDLFVNVPAGSIQGRHQPRPPFLYDSAN